MDVVDFVAVMEGFNCTILRDVGLWTLKQRTGPPCQSLCVCVSSWFGE